MNNLDRGSENTKEGTSMLVKEGGGVEIDPPWFFFFQLHMGYFFENIYIETYVYNFILQSI